MKKQEKIKVGISVGDLNGVGIEVILKTFEDSRMFEFCTPIIFGSSKSVSFHKKALGLDTGIHGVDRLDKVVHNKLNLLNVWKEMIDLELGTPTEISGKYALLSLRKATEALKKGEVDILVTAPIDKHNMSSEEFEFPGHTEYLEQELEGEALMILMTEELRVGLVTGHLPLKEGMSLRSFLSKMVHCNPKRISKKVRRFRGLAWKGRKSEGRRTHVFMRLSLSLSSISLFSLSRL